MNQYLHISKQVFVKTLLLTLSLVVFLSFSMTTPDNSLIELDNCLGVENDLDADNEDFSVAEEEYSNNDQMAAIFYGMDQTPVNTANAIIDATTNTSGTLDNTAAGMPELIQGAAPHSLTAWDFSQTEEYIRIPSNATTKRLGDLSKTDGLTIGFWMNYDYLPEYGNRYVAGLGNTFDILVSAEKIHVRYLETYVDAIASSSSDGIMNNGWQHIAVSLDFTQTTNNLNLYLNGNLIKTESYPITSSFNSMSHLNIGARSNNGNPYPGKLDDFIIFDEATSSTDVMKLYKKGAHHFIDPDDYTYEAASQPGGYSYAWDNYTKDEFTGFGERQVNFDYTGVSTISHAPPVGVHPRLFFSPHDIPEMKNRLQNTESGIAVMKYIHAFTTLLHIDFTTWTGESGYDVNADYAIDKDGNRLVGNVGHADTKIYYDRLIANDPTFYDDPDFSSTRRISLSTQMAMEAFECLIHEGEFDSDTGKSYNDRALDLAKAVTFWSSLIVDDPSILTQGHIFHYFHPIDMSLIYDINYRVMTESQRSIVRQALALTLPEYNEVYGYGMSCYSTTSNYTPLIGYQIIPNLVIEGEEGYDPELTHSWLRAMYNFITYGWNASGAGYEGLGKNYQFSTHLIAFAKRGYSLLGHPHVKSYGEDFLLGIMQPFGHAFSSNDTWGGSGPDDVTGGYKFNSTDAVGLKWIFKDSPEVDFVWRNYMQKLRNSDSYDYVYGNIPTSFGQTNVIVPAAIFALDYDKDKDFNTYASEVQKTDYFASDRGLSVMRSGTDSLSLSSHFHCRQDLGGHTNGDRNDFTLNGLGRMWVRKTYAGGNIEQTYYHSCILVNDLGVQPTPNEGNKARQPGKVIDYESNTDISTITGDATYAYTWEWQWRAIDTTSDHPLLGTDGWEKVTKTFNDFKYQPKAEIQYNTPLYDFPHWSSAGKSERMIQREFNPMQRVIRSTAMVRGENPFLLIVDDVQKDAEVHNYKWVAQIANDLTIESTNINLVDCDYQNDIILKEPDDIGNRRLLVRILHNEGYDGSTPNGYIDELEYIDMNGNIFTPNPNKYRQRLVVESNSVAPDFRVLMWPHNEGDALPTTTWNNSKDTLKVVFENEERFIALNPQDGGKWNKIELIEQGIESSCNDNDACTYDELDANCNCTNIFQDSDNDGICDTDDTTNGACALGAACNDNNACTSNDSYDENCNCVGTFQDSDEDGICDAEDVCQGFDDALIGSTCNDNNACTNNDTYDENCNCIGIVQDSDEDGICDTEDSCPTDPTNTCNDNPTPTPTPTNSYCTLTGNNTNYEYIGKTEIGNLVNPSGNDTGYGDYTNLSIIATLEEVLTIKLTPGFAGTAYEEYWVIWIDYNQDGDFEDTGEEVFTANGKTNVAGEFTIPPTALLGATRMRIAMQWNAAAAPCGTINYGEVEDYTIVIGESGAACTLTGQACNDNDACTTRDTYDRECNCIGTFQDSDADGICDDNDPCPNDTNNACASTALTYCTATGNSTQYEFIQAISFGNKNNESGNDGGYGDYTNVNTTAVLGTSYPIVLTPKFTGNPYMEYWKIWIDFNRDGDFEDDQEEVFSANSTATINGTIDIPTTVAAGKTTMRIAMGWNSAPSSCGTISYGEVEDYTIELTSLSSFNNISLRLATKSTSTPKSLEMRLFPNPVKEFINLDVQGLSTDAVLTIYDSRGQLYYTENLIADGILKIGTTPFPVGYYQAVLRLSDGTMKHVSFVKQ